MAERFQMRCSIFSCIALMFFIPTTFAADLLVASNGTAQLNHKTYRCALGKNGVSTSKQEGDLKTPMGQFPLRYLYYRPDKFPQGVKTQLPQKPLHPDFGWCDDSTSPYYNQFIHLPFSKSHEVLWRKDDIYDLIIVVGYNDDPVHKGKGSAIFIHLARDNYAPTHGCIAFSKKDLLEILEGLDEKSKVIVSI